MTAFDDIVLGRIEVPNVEIEDLVLVRSDGRPTYNFASPLEDMWDGITHVIRGARPHLEHAEADSDRRRRSAATSPSMRTSRT